KRTMRQRNIKAAATVPTAVSRIQANDNPNEEQSAPSALPPTRPGKTARQVKIDAAATVPTAVLTMAEHGSGIHKRSSERCLTGVELVQEVSEIAKNQDKAELMILELMEEYSFSFPRLKELLRGKLTIFELLVWLIVTLESNL